MITYEYRLSSHGLIVGTFLTSFDIAFDIPFCLLLHFGVTAALFGKTYTFGGSTTSFSVSGLRRMAMASYTPFCLRRLGLDIIALS